MCLIVKESCEIHVAEEPIAVFKRVDRGFFCWYSPLHDTETKRKYNVKLKACDHLKIRLLSGFIERAIIHEGFHAFKTIPAPQDSCCTLPNFAVIPKGAEYCYGKYDDVVATEIIVFRTKRQFYKYLKKNELR